MSITKRLGRIAGARFGYGGYQDAMFGLSLEGEGWGVSDFQGGWSLDIEVSQHTKWTEADREVAFAQAVRLLNDTLRQAKKRHIAELVGVPVEVTFDGMVISSWRVLTEVVA